VALAAALGVLGSLDINRGDAQSGWDTDQFPHNVPDVTLALLHVLKAGGLGSGGLNFDAKIRRQSIDPDDLLHAHIGGMDVCARALLAAARIMEDGGLQQALDARYAGWATPQGQHMLRGKASLADIASSVTGEPQPRSGRQEYLENLVNRFV
jgi:xylose isomerase